MSFEKLGLRAELLRAVSTQGYDTPTPIQKQAIPEILNGKDVMGGAQTGTGKTAAYTLPMLHRLGKKSNKMRHPRALILAPTRELAAQVAASINTYGKHLSLRSTVIYGGVKIGPQIGSFRRGIDILVATPGRLLDHVGRRTVDLSHVTTFVLDEADRMLDMGFIPDIRKIIKQLPENRQTLFFSATYSKEINRLSKDILVDPVMVQVSPKQNQAAESVVQKVHPVDRSQKRELLSHLIKTGSLDQVLVFTRTKNSANLLTKHLLAQGVSAAAIHGNKSQANRTRALADFKKGSVRTLVATDIASRGLDIDHLPHVVNYELPHVPEDYVHRIGRTGRAGAAGIALSLVSSDERKQLSNIQRLLNHTIPVEIVDGFTAQLQPWKNNDGPARPKSRFRPKTAKRGQSSRKPHQRQRA